MADVPTNPFVTPGKRTKAQIEAALAPLDQMILDLIADGVNTFREINVRCEPLARTMVQPWVRHPYKLVERRLQGLRKAGKVVVRPSVPVWSITTPEDLVRMAREVPEKIVNRPNPIENFEAKWK